MMNKDTQNIYEAYVTESPDQIAKIDKRIARLQSKKARLQQSGATSTSPSPSTTTSSSTSTTTTGAASSAASSPEKEINNNWSQFQPAATPSTPDAAPTVATTPATPNPFDTHGVKDFDANNPFHVAQAQGMTKPAGPSTSSSTSTSTPNTASSDATGDITTLDPIDVKASRNRNSPDRIAALQKRQAENPGVGPDRTFGTGAPSDEESAAASAAIDSGEISSKPAGTEFDPWRQEQMRINKTAEMPDNWRNASWAKRARTMGGRNPARVKALAQKEWERKEAMRKEREMATSKLNPNRQTGAQYLGNQLIKAPGEIVRGVGNLVAAPFKAVSKFANRNKQPQAPSKPLGPSRQKLSKPSDFQNPVRDGVPYVSPNKNKKQLDNASYNAFDAVLQDKNVDHLID